MELRTVDPRVLLPNPHNPRRTPASPNDDRVMIASIIANGVLQPPLVRASADTDGSEQLTVVFGDRRRRLAIEAGRETIHVLVKTGVDEMADPMEAVTENIVRAEMGPVDRWRAMEALAAAGWTDPAICDALGVGARDLAKFRLLGRICPPMLDRMALGDMPTEHTLRVIAAASTDQQMEVWKANKPKKNELVSWLEIYRGLNVTRLYARDASFGPDEAEAFGIVWQEDLFAPANIDSRTTTQIDAYVGAQQAWLDAHLPKNGVIVLLKDNGGVELPKGAKPSYGKPARGDKVAHALHPSTGRIVTQTFTPAPKATVKKGAAADAQDGDEIAETPPVKAARAEVTQKGVAIIGDLRTDALHETLRTAPVDDLGLVALLVLALGSQNVDVKTGVKDHFGSSELHRLAALLSIDGMPVRDAEIIRLTARRALVEVLSCRVDHSNSGATARIAGVAINADQHLPNMATAEFLACMTKTAIGHAAEANGVRVGPRGKDTQASMLERFQSGTWVYPGALFKLIEAELTAAKAAEERKRACEARYGASGQTFDGTASDNVIGPDDVIDGPDDTENAPDPDAQADTDGEPDTDDPGTQGSLDEAGDDHIEHQLAA